MTELKSCPGEMPRSPLAVSAGGLIDDRAGRAGRGRVQGRHTQVQAAPSHLAPLSLSL